MGQIEKLIERLKSKPNDFTYDEAVKLLNHFGYEPSDKGKTSGSRVGFYCPGRTPIMLHKPHPGNELPGYIVRQLISKLKEEQLI
ncbi:MAG: type II toxin-antitoxin system HicA family toxin [Clostridia bacterium]|nr:type II toxin-antitoxin system HicA family toxin [Clostridia bacterium]